MSVRLLSQTAFSLFYACNRIVIVSPAVAKKLSKAQPLEGVEYLIVGTDGVLTVSGEVAYAAPLLAPVGAPIGVKAFIVDANAPTNANAWRDWIAEQTGRTPPAVFELGRRPTLQDIYAAIAECMIADAQSTRAQSARTEQDLVSLRWDHEQALINLEQARRVIRGAGFDTRYVTMSLPVGADAIGPDRKSISSTDPFAVRYVMPCDAAGLVGLSLHFATRGAVETGGRLQMTLTRVVDRQIIGRASLKYEDISTGWTYFGLDNSVAGTFGDCALTIEWLQTAEGAAPTITLSEMLPDQRGGETATNLLPAMQMWSGFDAGGTSSKQLLLPSGSDKKQFYFADLMASGDIFGIADQSDLEISKTWVQTHLQDTGAVGIIVPDCAPPTASTIEVTCETAHEAGPPALYMVALFEGDKAPAESIWSDLLKDVKSGERENTGFDANTGVHWSTKLVTPGRLSRLELAVQPENSGKSAYTMVCAALSATEGVSYGWCRWHDLKVAYQVDIQASVGPKYEPALLHRMKSVKFPEIGEQLTYLAGQAKLHQQAEELGFSPMIVAEDNGSLQTHPLLEGISAALYPGGAGAGTTRIACDVETAHEQSPVFCYVLLLLPSSVADKYSAVESIISRQLGSMSTTRTGFDDETGAHYCARHLNALDVKSVVIELEKRLTEPHDIVVAALPVQGIISYGWCRWLSLSISSAVDVQPDHRLSAEAD